MATDTRAAAVVRAVIDLTHTLGLTVVAEGVEDADTATWLREQGCDVGQGYHFGFPVGAADVAMQATLSRLQTSCCASSGKCARMQAWSLR